MKIARWTDKPIPGHATPTRKTLIRAGQKGTGRKISVGIEYWPSSSKSVEGMLQHAAAQEAAARADGWTVLPLEDDDWR